MKNTPNTKARNSGRSAQANGYGKGFRAGQRALIGRLLHIVQHAQTIDQARRAAKTLLCDFKGGR